jgi:hypothetical protein
LCWRDTARWPVVLVVVLVLDPLGSMLHPTFDYENEDEKQSKRDFRFVPTGLSGLELELIKTRPVGMLLIP